MRLSRKFWTAIGALGMGATYFALWFLDERCRKLERDRDILLDVNEGLQADLMAARRARPNRPKKKRRKG